MPSSSDHAAVSRAARTTALGAYLEGWRRALKAPYVVAGLLVMTLLTTVPLAIVVGSSLEGSFGSSQEAEQALAGWNQEWVGPLADAGVAGTLVTEIMGFGGVFLPMDWLLDGRIPAPFVGALAMYLLMWIFLSGGIIDRLARSRPLGADVFMATCGRHFLRLLRFGIIVAAGYWAIFRWVHPLIFDLGVVRLAGADASEGRLFALRLSGYAVFLGILAFYALVADMARVRMVVEDRFSAVAGWLAGWRFVRRRAGRASWLFLLNVLGQAVIARLWLQAMPSAAGPDWLVLVAGQLYVLMRLWTRLAFIASEVVFFQGELGHATYVAAPVPMWPESASVEALGNLRQAGDSGRRPRLR
jgi:hypothetical protein